MKRHTCLKKTIVILGLCCLLLFLILSTTRVFVFIQNGRIVAADGEVFNPIIKATMLVCMKQIELSGYKEQESITATGVELLFYGGFMGGTRNFTIVDAKTKSGNVYTIYEGKVYCNILETSDFRRVYTNVPKKCLKHWNGAWITTTLQNKKDPAKLWQGLFMHYLF